LKIPMLFLAATKSDQFRKPAVGAWEYLKNKVFKGCSIDMKNSFYCGDAAGRPKTATAPKDFSDSDIKFAFNAGLAFKTPEEFFLDQK
jgi:bifunctional polynucleotide phosphatase/kinase